jgi:hypothetical protein
VVALFSHSTRGATAGCTTPPLIGGKKTGGFQPFIQKRSFYQDRLGTTAEGQHSLTKETRLFSRSNPVLQTQLGNHSFDYNIGGWKQQRAFSGVAHSVVPDGHPLKAECVLLLLLQLSFSHYSTCLSPNRGGN